MIEETENSIDVLPLTKKILKEKLPLTTKILEKNHSVNQELSNILEFFGRKDDKARIAKDHFIQIVSYLLKTQKEEYNKTLSKLSLLCSTNQRYIRENYLEGLESFDIIEVYVENNKKNWIWRGL